MTTVTKTLPLDDLRTLLPDWETSLKARNRTKETIRSYLRSTNDLLKYLAAAGMPTTATGVKREHIEAFLAAGLERLKPGSVAKDYRSIQQFFRWLEEEGEITTSPMAKMKPPNVPEQPVPILTDDELRKLLKARSGTDFYSRRDTAIMRVLIDSGCRREELAMATVADVDFDHNVLHVIGKGRRGRAAPFGTKTAEALRRYLRARARHPYAERSDRLWLGRSGAVTPDGLNDIMQRIGRDAGVADVHPHRFRHSAAHTWLAAGGQENDLRRIMGWKSPQMVARYAASAADERAREAHKRMGLGDRF